MNAKNNVNAVGRWRGPDVYALKNADMQAVP